MKHAFAIAAFCIFSSTCFAQWTTSATNSSNIYFNNGVSIGIDKVPTNFKFAVAGSIIAEEVVIKVRGSWPDYVFEPSYQIMNLSELEKFILLNKHLPEVPAAAEVEKNGVSVGEMNAVLLKKIEELTLYVIELKKETEALKNEVEALKK